MAKAYAQSNAVEHGLGTRATIVDMREQLNVRQWEETASAAIGHVWFADCESFCAHLICPNTKQVDNERWAIDVSKKSMDRTAIILVGSTRLRCYQIAQRRR